MLSFTLVALPYTAHAATLTSDPGAYGRHGEPILAYLVDHLGTIRGAVNQAGTVVETRDYAPFGESIAKTGTFAVQHRFTGQPQDDQAGGLYNYGARFYNPKWGRFVSPDEVVQGFDSQGLNPFTYVLNQPTSGSDPTGEFASFSAPAVLLPTLGAPGGSALSVAFLPPRWENLIVEDERNLGFLQIEPIFDQDDNLIGAVAVVRSSESRYPAAMGNARSPGGAPSGRPAGLTSAARLAMKAMRTARAMAGKKPTSAEAPAGTGGGGGGSVISRHTAAP